MHSIQTYKTWTPQKTPKSTTRETLISVSIFVVLGSLFLHQLLAVRASSRQLPISIETQQIDQPLFEPKHGWQSELNPNWDFFKSINLNSRPKGQPNGGNYEFNQSPYYVF